MSMELGKLLSTIICAATFALFSPAEPLPCFTAVRKQRTFSTTRVWNELPGMRPTTTVSSTEPLNDILGIWQSSQRREITQQPFGEAGPKMTAEEEILSILTGCGLLVKTSGIQFLRERPCPTGWSLSTKACGIIVLTAKVNLTRNR